MEMNPSKHSLGIFSIGAFVGLIILLGVALSIPYVIEFSYRLEAEAAAVFALR